MLVSLLSVCGNVQYAMNPGSAVFLGSRPACIAFSADVGFAFGPLARDCRRPQTANFELQADRGYVARQRVYESKPNIESKPAIVYEPQGAWQRLLIQKSASLMSRRR